jgi:chromatin segregation and condensation protein Rec8/ScpA/Scc1 (kleisin family)
MMSQLEERLQVLDVGRGVSIEAWFEELRVPEARVALLLALLELARLQRILVAQRDSFGAILLKRIERSVEK